jgi:hypothetical protein
LAVTASLNDVLPWVDWRHGTETLPEDVSPQHLRHELNTDFEAATLGAKELTALAAAWQQGAISRDTLLHNLRAGEILPPARTNEGETELISGEGPPSVKREAGSLSVKGEDPFMEVPPTAGASWTHSISWRDFRGPGPIQREACGVRPACWRCFGEPAGAARRRSART